MEQTAINKIEKLQKISLIAGLIGLALSALGFMTSRTDFAFSYLAAYLYVIGFAVGSLPLVMLHHLTGGGWGYAIRRLLEIFLKLMPWLTLAFIPVILTMKQLYIWTDADLVAHDHLLQRKTYYLNIPMFLTRTALYFMLWNFFAAVLRGGSLKFNKTGDDKFLRGLKQASGIGLVVYCITSSFAGIDWSMTLDPHWFSTMYGVFFMIGDGITAFAAAILLSRYLAAWGPLKTVLTEERSHDLGKLLFAFIMFWAYINLSQFIIIWAGNLPEETPWYLKRFNNGWNPVSLALTFFHFVIPFLLLLSRDLKRNPGRAAAIASVVLFMRWVEMFWHVKPSHYEYFHFHWLDVTCVLALAGLSLSYVLGQILKEPLTLSDDPCVMNPEAARHV